MRVATWNIRHGRPRRGRVVDLAAFADAVRRLDADVLALQEVDRGQRRSGGADLGTVAAEAMGAVAARFAATLTGTPGWGWRPVSGEPGPHEPAYGVALLSRLPVRDWRTVPLPGHEWRGHRDEPRVGLMASLDALTVVSTHLSFVAPWAREQLEVLSAAAPTGPVLLAGDLNLTDPLADLVADPLADPLAGSLAASGWRSLGGAPTWPAGRPRRRLDHVLARGEVGAVRHVSTVDLGVSDHRALVVELS